MKKTCISIILLVLVFPFVCHAVDAKQADLEGLRGEIDVLRKEVEKIDQLRVSDVEKLEAMDRQNRDIDIEQNRNIEGMQKNLQHMLESLDTVLKAQQRVEKETRSGFERWKHVLPSLKNDALIRDRQIEDIRQKISLLQKDMEEMLASLERAVKAGSTQNQTIKALDTRVKNAEALSSEQKQRVDAMENGLKDIRNVSRTQFQNIHQTISRRSLYWIIAILVVALMSSILFLILKYKLASSRVSLDRQLQTTKSSLAAESVKIDSKLIEVLESQLNITARGGPGNSRQAEARDHSLAVQMGKEIHRMHKRIEHVPESTKGLSALKNSLKRLEDEFKKNGYEIVDLMGKPYMEGMTLKARFTPSRDLKPGEGIVSKVIVPQINYNGVLIQPAEVEVSLGE